MMRLVLLIARSPIMMTFAMKSYLSDFSSSHITPLLFLLLQVLQRQMSTIDKCCQTVKDFQNILNEIKFEKQKMQEREEKNHKGLPQNDRKKILKLFNYDKWASYMKWIDQKLQESGEDLQSFIDVSRIVSASSSEMNINNTNDDQITTKKQAKYEEAESFSAQNETEFDLLSKENRKLTKQNSLLKKKYEDIKRAYTNIMK